MKTLIKLFIILLLISCSKEETNDVINDCSCVEEIYEHDFRTDVFGNELNYGELLDIKETGCQTTRNEARTNNDYPESESDLLWVIIKCN